MIVRHMIKQDTKNIGTSNATNYIYTFHLEAEGTLKELNWLQNKIVEIGKEASE